VSPSVRKIKILKILGCDKTSTFLDITLLVRTLNAEVLQNNKGKGIILPVVLYGCETWSLTLKQERRLRVFENRVLRRIFGRKRDEVTGNGENYIIRS
jgi:hypothetical protein